MSNRVPYRAPSWRKPRMEAQIVARLREMFSVPDEDDLPEPLLLMLGLQAALNGHFAEGNLTNEMYVMMGHLAEIFHRTRPPARVPEGTLVRIPAMQATGIYVSRGMLDKDLINSNGRF